MPVVILKNENISNTYDIGDHILGRGKELECNSKKVSRKHGILKVSIQGVYLESTHNNPCFHKPDKVSNVAIISFGNNVQLSDNDQIALCLDHGWFTVQLQQNDQSTNDTSYENALTQPLTTNDTVLNDSNASNTSISSNITVKCPLYEETEPQTLKRPLEDETETQAKKQKSDDTAVEIKTEPIDDTIPNDCDQTTTVETTVEQEIKTEGEIKTEAEIKIEDTGNQVGDDTNNNNDDKPSTSGINKRPWRDRCWYGVECYRKNANHRVEFTHPGDSDYDSDANDSRPICCYGANCYRKNREHRKRYRHPGQKKIGKSPPPQPPPKRRIKKPKPIDPLSQDSEELDDYDYSDPFLDDGSEDEYEPSQETDTESDYEESQEVDEDNKRLLKEARKFTRNK